MMLTTVTDDKMTLMNQYNQDRGREQLMRRTEADEDRGY